jgi:hypothetical protein
VEVPFVEVAAVKQGIRFILKPKTFFNQLQWSRNHWLILVSFLVLATVETQVGRHSHVYEAYAFYLQNRFGFSLNFALWLLMAAKLVFMLAGSFAIATVVWVVGSVVGQKNSKRVLYRRLAVVFTVVLAGFTANHLADRYNALNLVALALYLWGLVLGYIAIREQFDLGHLETSIVAIFAILMVTTTWHFSNHVFEATVRDQLPPIGKKIEKSPKDQLSVTSPNHL